MCKCRSSFGETMLAFDENAMPFPENWQALPKNWQALPKKWQGLPVFQKSMQKVLDQGYANLRAVVSHLLGPDAGLNLADVRLLQV